MIPPPTHFLENYFAEVKIKNVQNQESKENFTNLSQNQRMRGKFIYLLQENFTTKTYTYMCGYDAIEIYETVVSVSRNATTLL